MPIFEDKGDEIQTSANMNLQKKLAQNPMYLYLV
jgi:hypothetical protein